MILILSVIALASLHFVAKGLLLTLRVARWQRTTGVITHSEVCRGWEWSGASGGTINVTKPTIQYTYNVGEETYTGSCIGLFPSEFGVWSPEDQVRRYPLGREVNVFYDPLEPKSAMLSIDRGPCVKMLAFVAAIGLTAAAVAITMTLRRLPPEWTGLSNEEVTRRKEILAELRATAERWNEAEARGDVATATALLAPACARREQYLRLVKERTTKSEPTYETRYELGKLEGDRALLIVSDYKLTQTEEGEEPRTERGDRQYVFVLSGGKWLLVSFEW